MTSTTTEADTTAGTGTGAGASVTAGETTAEVPGSCVDGMISQNESDVDCGGPCPACLPGQMCNAAEDCAESYCVDGTCAVPRACRDLPDLPSGVYTIDADGAGDAPPFEVVCEMDLAGGGWTLAIVSSDDGLDTWSFDNAGLWTNGAILGDPAQPHLDLKSAAASAVPFLDLLFVHQPSEVYAAYADVAGGRVPFTVFMAAVSPPPVCGPASARASR